MHVVLPPFGASVFGLKPEAGFFLIGVVQLAYVVPTLMFLMASGRGEMAKGMLFAALATFVLNAGGCAWFLWSLRGID